MIYNYLFENPIPLVMLGLVAATFTVVLYFTTKSLGAFVASIVIAVLTLCGLVMEQLVYTERELVEVAISGICQAAENNDQDQVMAYLAPSADETRKMVEAIMPRVEVMKANVMTDIIIELDDPQNPKQATATFKGFFQGRLKAGGAIGGDRFPVVVELVRDEHRWLVESFTSDKDFEKAAAELSR